MCQGGARAYLNPKGEPLQAATPGELGNPKTSATKRYYRGTLEEEEISVAVRLLYTRRSGLPSGVKIEHIFFSKGVNKGK